MLKLQKFGASLAIGGLLLAATSTQAAETLTIGSKAPSLDVEHWMSTAHDTFEPVEDFEKDRVYVVEFWATWCGPCIASMPHLAELQEKFADRGVQIISISDEDTDTVKSFLKRKVRGWKEGDEGPETYADLTSAYCLTTDPDESSHESYMRAAAQNGIPTSFIVGKTGLVEWIGHPMSIDEPLEEVCSDEWDRETFAEEFKKAQEFDVMMMDIFKLMQTGKFDDAMERLEEGEEKYDGRQADQLKMFKTRIRSMQLDAMVKAGKADEALEIMDEMIAAAKGPEAMTLQMDKLNLLISAEKLPAAAELLVEMKDAPPMLINQATWTIYEMAEAKPDSVSDELLQAAIAATESAVEKEPTAPIIDTLAHLVYATGDLDAAIEWQTKAVEAEANADPQITGFLKQLKKEKKASEKKDK